jgi:signal transduction histidine kinase
MRSRSYSRQMTRTRRIPTRDALLPTALAVIGVAEMAAMRPYHWGFGAMLEVVVCALLVFRRRNPLVLATLASVVMFVIPWVGPQLDQASAPIPIWALAVFSLARWLPDLRGLIGVAVMAAAVFADYTFVDQRHHNWSDVIFICALIAPPFVLGRVTRKLADQKGLLEQNQELVRREAVRAERDLIARELHDVIAHSVSAMVVQTAAAQDLVRADPDRAEKILSAVATTGRRALSEAGRLLHVIRDDADELGLQPAPGLADLPDLIERFRADGMQVTVEVCEPLPALPAGVDVSAYRIVQEALTNALRYGADRTAALRVSCTPTALSIHASNPSNGTSGLGSGLGLLGIAERVSLLGGGLSHGVGGDGRFELDATLPLATS